VPTVQFEFTEEQKMIASMIGEFARAEGTSEKVRQAMETEAGYLPTVWQSMASELGLCGLLVPESAGGQGLSMVEAALVFEHLGKMLLPSPLLATAVLGVSVLKALDQRTYLERIAGGELTTAVACLRGGKADFVLDAGAADLLILMDEAAPTISIVEADRKGVAIEPVATLDQTRRLAHVTVTDAGVLRECQAESGDKAVVAIEKAFNVARIALAAEAAGASQTCLDRTVEYTGERVQFGRQIGSYQAVKHQMADMMIAIEAAISAVYFAACAISEGHGDSPQLAAMAKVQASEALTFCAGRMIQLHGGIGFTWEHDAHLYFKRARSTMTLFGLNADLDEYIASRVGLGACG